MSIAKTMSAFLLGAAAGITIGVLYAPEKGTTTRKNITGKKDDLLYEAEFKVEEGKEYVRDTYKKGKDFVTDKFGNRKKKTPLAEESNFTDAATPPYGAAQSKRTAQGGYSPTAS